MDIIEISPPKHFNFSIPNDLHRVLTITNLTLRPVYVGILKSHVFELSISKQWFLLEGFQEMKIDIVVNWSQEGRNLSVGKLRIYYWEVEDEVPQDEMRQTMFENKDKILFQEITIHCELDFKSIDSINYKQIIVEETVSYESINNQTNKKYYLMRRAHPLKVDEKEKKILKGEKLRNQVLTHLQDMKFVVSIEAFQNNQSYLIQFSNQKEDSSEFITFYVEGLMIVFAITRLVVYGKSNQIQTLVNIEEGQSHHILKEQKKHAPKVANDKESYQVMNEREHSQAIAVQNKPQLLPEFIRSASQPFEEKNNDEDNQDLIVREPKNKKKIDLTKQTFAMRRQGEKGKKRRNKSQQKIIQKSSDQEEIDEEALIKEQLRSYRRADNFQIKPPPPLIIKEVKEVKIRRQIKINQTNIEMNQKVLNIYIDSKPNITEIYVILRDCIRCFVLEDPNFKKTLKFDPIDEDNVGMPCPVDIYQQQLIFGNESYIFWVNLQTGYNEWKYVQRKYIYAVSVIEQLSLVALGGKNFSKLSYFGKQTSRSNLKLYSCSSSDKHEHLFTYDFPGVNVGNVINMAYISAPPHGTKLLLVHTINNENKSTFFFLRVKAFNKIEVFSEIELDELGILNLLKFKYNKDTNRIICLESLGGTEIDTFKRLKIKCQYEKVQVSTEGFKFPLKRYISYHIGGGGKDSIAKEWMSLVQQNGQLFHLYDFETNKFTTFQLGKGQIRQVFTIQNGKYLIICSDTMVRVRESIQFQVKQ